MFIIKLKKELNKLNKKNNLEYIINNKRKFFYKSLKDIWNDIVISVTKEEKQINKEYNKLDILSKSYKQQLLKGDIINIGAGDNRSVNQIADLLGGERIYKDPVIEPRETLADNEKAEMILGWKPTMKIENWMVGYKKGLGI